MSRHQFYKISRKHGKRSCVTKVAGQENRTAEICLIKILSNKI